MSRTSFVIADVFAERRFGGNPLAVLPDARGLSESDMLAVAREFGYSETTFVLPSFAGSASGTSLSGSASPANDRTPRHRVRIFSPAGELPFAGHPIVGTAAVLVSSGGDVSQDSDADAERETALVFETGAGLVPVRVRRTRDASRAWAQLTAPVLPSLGGDPPPGAVLAEVLALGTGDVGGPGGAAPAMVRCGATFCMVPVRDESALMRARVDAAAWARVFGAAPETELYAFVVEDGDASAGVRLTARMFAPGLGIAEDPATGAAGVAVAGYFAALGPGGGTPDDGTHRWVISQGAALGRPSRIEVEADLAAGAVRAVRVSGDVVVVADGTMLVEP